MSFHFVDGFLFWVKAFACYSPICLFIYLFILSNLPEEIYLKKYCYEKCLRFYCLCFPTHRYGKQTEMLEGRELGWRGEKGEKIKKKKAL